MIENRKWNLSVEDKSQLIDRLTSELAPLRIKIGISQDELANLIGISRQTYGAIERGSRKMTWNTYLSLILFYDYNNTTHEFIRKIGAFPDKLVEVFNRMEEE